MRFEDCLRATLYSELGKNSSEMIFYGSFGNRKRRRDRPIAGTPPELAQNIQLSLGQPQPLESVARRGRGQPGERSYQLGGDSRRQQRLTAGGQPDSVNQEIQRGVPQKVAQRARPNRFENGLIVF